MDTCEVPAQSSSGGKRGKADRLLRAYRSVKGSGKGRHGAFEKPGRHPAVEKGDESRFVRQGCL